MATKPREYRNDDITVVWKPDICIHSANCFNNLSAVFNPNQRPWINMAAASTEEIKTTVDKCPSGALSYRSNIESVLQEVQQTQSTATEINILADGPYIVSGTFRIRDKDGNDIEGSEKVALCRCGASQKKPFCDGAHKVVGFKDE